MSPKIFLTGATGYIGGSVLDTIVSNHPEYHVTVLLRRIPSDFSSRYPAVKIVQGDYDRFDILAKCASEADIVIHNGDSDHEPSVNALIAGLLRRSTPGFLIHLSGTGIVADFHNETYLGKLNPKIWSDIDDIEAIASLPDTALHRNTEKILRETTSKYGDKVRIAIMCPPDIYGKGLGLGKTRSAFVPMFVNESRTLGNRVFYYNEGTNTRSWVHISDLMQVYLKVVEAAASNGEGASWGKEGYYFAGSQEASHLEVATAVGKFLKKHGAIENEEPLQVSLETLDAMRPRPAYPPLSRYLFASNSRTRPERAVKLFGYTPKGPLLLQALEDDIVAEIQRA